MSLIRIKPIRRKNLIITAAIPALVVIALIGWLLWANLNKNKTDPIAQPSIDEVLATGIEYGDENDIDGGLAYYDEQIENRVDKSEKQQLLLYKSSFAAKAGRSEAAVESAQKADEIESNTASLMALANAFDSEGNKEQAVLYYKKLIEGLPAEENMESRYRAEWEQRIEELQN